MITVTGNLCQRKQIKLGKGRTRSVSIADTMLSIIGVKLLVKKYNKYTKPVTV